MGSPAFWLSGHAGQGRAQPGSSQTCQQDTWRSWELPFQVPVAPCNHQKTRQETSTGCCPWAVPILTSPGKISKGSRRRQWACAQPRLVRPDADHQRWKKSTGAKAHMVRRQLQMPHSLSVTKYSSQLLSQSHQVCPGCAFSSSGEEHQGRADPSQAVLDIVAPPGAYQTQPHCL